jgi:hypothetical protein
VSSLRFDACRRAQLPDRSALHADARAISNAISNAISDAISDADTDSHSQPKLIARAVAVSDHYGHAQTNPQPDHDAAAKTFAHAVSFTITINISQPIALAASHIAGEI